MGAEAQSESDQRREKREAELLRPAACCLQASLGLEIEEAMGYIHCIAVCVNRERKLRGAQLVPAVFPFSHRPACLVQAKAATFKECELAHSKDRGSGCQKRQRLTATGEAVNEASIVSRVRETMVTLSSLLQKQFATVGVGCGEPGLMKRQLHGTSETATTSLSVQVRLPSLQRTNAFRLVAGRCARACAAFGLISYRIRVLRARALPSALAAAAPAPWHFNEVKPDRRDEPDHEEMAGAEARGEREAHGLSHLGAGHDPEDLAEEEG
jgi:hypothetical protein